MKTFDELKAIDLLIQQLRKAEIARNIQQHVASTIAESVSELAHKYAIEKERLTRAKSELLKLESDVLITKAILKVNTND